MRKARLTVVIAVISVAVVGGHLIAESRKTQEYSWDQFAFAENSSQQASWEQVKPQLKYMPRLPPGTVGLVIADIDTFVPRRYFDMPPPLRFMMPVHHGNATAAAFQAGYGSE